MHDARNLDLVPRCTDPVEDRVRVADERQAKHARLIGGGCDVREIREAVAGLADAILNASCSPRILDSDCVMDVADVDLGRSA
jgi:hypothetical protein